MNSSSEAVLRISVAAPGSWKHTKSVHGELIVMLMPRAAQAPRSDAFRNGAGILTPVRNPLTPPPRLGLLPCEGASSTGRLLMRMLAMVDPAAAN